MKLQNEIFRSSVSEEKRGMLFNFFKNSKNQVLLTKQRKRVFSIRRCFSDTEIEFLHGNDSTGIAHDSPCQSVRVHFVQLLKCEKLNKTEISEQMERHGESKWFSSSDNQLARPCERHFAPCCLLCLSV